LCQRFQNIHQFRQPDNSVSVDISPWFWLKLFRKIRICGRFECHHCIAQINFPVSTDIPWPEPAMTWKEALAYCETLTLGGPEDWRLPTIKELASLADLDRINPAISIEYFTDTSGTSAYWTSTTYAGDIASAWGMAFDLGNDNIHSKSGKYHVRAVRGGWVSVTGLILVAGGGIDDDNTLKESTKYLADLVCSRFLGRGFDEKDIYYFDPNGPNGPFYDFNGNGEKDLIVSDETPTVEELSRSIEISSEHQRGCEVFRV